MPKLIVSIACFDCGYATNYSVVHDPRGDLKSDYPQGVSNSSLLINAQESDQSELVGC